MPSRFYRIGRSASGLGMFAIKPIKPRTYIATYRGPVISNEEAARRERRGARYMFEINRKWTIDGTPRWNIGRYLNHSCEPNAKPVLRKGRIVFVALRRIAPGEEITYDYGQEYFDYFIATGDCLCASCRKRAAVRRSKRKAARRSN
jgi:hypothetical protein